MQQVCPQCRTKYSGAERFCPDDGARLIDASEVGPAPEQDPLVGTILSDRYRILRVLGGGGMGVVYEAEHTVIEKPVAVKVLRGEVATDAAVVERFLQEARSASRIGHENIIDISDFGRIPSGAPFLVMELLSGKDLGDLLEEEGTLPVERAVPILLQCCRALAAAHSKGIIHRDIKPENIFLVDRRNNPDFVKIVDFGIAKINDLEQPGRMGRKLTKTGMIFGTPEFMSPEQAYGRPADHRSDIYALGVIMYEMFAGRAPFMADTFMGVLTKHMFDPPPGIRTLNPSAEVPLSLHNVIMRALAKDPEDRQQSMTVLADEILAASDASGITFAGQDAHREAVLAATTSMRAPPPPGSISTPVDIPGAPPLPAETRAGVPSWTGSTPSPTRASEAVAVDSPYPHQGPRVPTDVHQAPPPRVSTALVPWLVVGLVGGLSLAGVGGYFLLRPDAEGRSTTEAVPDPNGLGAAGNGGGDEALQDGGGPVVAQQVSMDAGQGSGPRPTVRLSVVSYPSGAEARLPNGTVVCPETPCEVDAPEGAPFVLELSKGRRIGTLTVTPEADQQVTVRLRPASRRTRDAGTSMSSRDAGRPLQHIPGLKVPDHPAF